MTNYATLPSSFRDPSGFVYSQDGLIYRQIKPIYKENYDHLINSGLYKALVNAELLIPHDELDLKCTQSEIIYKTIRPELIPFISYPYEWSFSQLKDAALLTLKLQRTALDYGMSLKDCSAYNVQFRNCKPVFIDTLSFEKYIEGRPWVAYRQFCQHFLAPLSLMSYKDIRLNQLLRICMDGIPLDLASLLLPPITYLNPALLFHTHLHAKSQKYFEKKQLVKSTSKVSHFSLLALIDSLESSIKSLKWKPDNTEWANYYENTNYSTGALSHKKNIVTNYLEINKPNIVIDLGANEGLFSPLRLASSEASKLLSDKRIQTISFDLDPACVEKNYTECIKNGTNNILPLLLDLTNPSPAIGWANKERASFLERFSGDTVMALALIHHLAISNNLPFEKIADFFSKLGKSLIIEFIPKSDSQVQRLLSNREDIFFEYSQQAFENEFNKYFTIKDSQKIIDSQRTIYNMVKKHT